MAFFKILCKVLNRKILDYKNLASEILQNLMCSLTHLGLLFSCIITSAFCIDYTDYSLPSTITLNGGQRQDAITSTRSPQGWTMTTIGLNRNPHLSISGGAGSQYALQVRDNTTTFFSGGISVSSGIQAALTSAHTLAIENGSISVASGGSFSVISSGNTINVQGSEYGGESKVRFSRDSALSLAQNAKADFNNAKFFIHDGSTLLAQGANLTVQASTIRFQNNLTNNGGSVTLSGNVYNVGGTVGVRNDNTTSSFTLNSGNVTVNGNFYNGIESNNMSVDTTGSVAGGFNSQDPAFGGGGNLIINGGTMRVTGSLISQQGGTSINGGGISNPQNSSISIYGGTLSATGGVQNLTGSTLTIGADSNGKMGQIIGNLTNSGEAIIDANGANAGNHTLITGNLTGNISLKNGNTQFASSSLKDKTLTVTLNQDQINNFNTTLTHNQSATLNALGNKIYTTNGATSARLTTVANALNSDIFNLFVSMPFAITDTLKSSLQPVATNTSNATKSKSSTNAVEIAFIGNIMQQNNDIDYSFLGGNAGLKLGYAKDFNLLNKNAPLPATIYLSALYLYTNAKNSQTNALSKQNSHFSSHAIGLNASFFVLLDRNKRFGFRNTLGGVMAFMSAKREVDSALLVAKYTLDSSPNFYLITLDSVLNYELLKNPSIFSLSPYFGLSQRINILPSFEESTLAQNSTTTPSQIALKSTPYNAYHLGLLTGLSAKFALSGLNKFNSRTDVAQKGILSAKVEYEYLAFASQKAIILQYQASQNANSLHFGLPHSHKVGVNIGFAKDFANGVNLGFEALFKAYLNPTRDIAPEIMGQNLFLYGANIAVGYRF